MMRRRRARGITRVDVLVLLAVGVFVLVVAGPLVSKPREQSGRVLCKANLGIIGKAMFVYASDHENQLPRAGGVGCNWGTVNWNASERSGAYDTDFDGNGGKATISSCFYLLVKHLEMPTRLFVCPGDFGTKPFSLAEDGDISTRDFSLADAWDFGMRPYRHCSYTCQSPFGAYPLSTTADPNLPVAADRNPWIMSPAANAADYSVFLPDLPDYGGTAEMARNGNAISHQGDGQNVLFLDGRVIFEHRAFCGLDDDNIYTRSSIVARGDSMGSAPSMAAPTPSSRRDSLLLHDPPNFPSLR